MRELNSLLTIASRDFTKLLRDRPRILISLIFPVIFIGALGKGFQSNLGSGAGFDFLTFTFTGVFAQTLFQSTAMGIISLVQDRENDFSQEIFVSPVSRYTIIVGKILGETLVSYVQVIGVLIIGLILGVQISPVQFLGLMLAGLIACMFGGAFGTLVLANLGNQRTANQIFPFLMFPQFFLGGVFTPIQNLPLILWILSRISPMTYAVDFIRSVFYSGTGEYDKVVLYGPVIDLLIISIMFVVMLSIGTFLFVRNERNR